MPHFFFRLIGPRPTFPHDITVEERALMGSHAEYTRSFFDQGFVLAYGPVLDPEGAFGVALIDAENLQAVERFAKADPSIAAGMNTYSIAPMMIAGSQPAREQKPADSSR